MQRAARRLKTEADAALLDASGLTTAQAAVMAIVTNDGPVTQSHVARMLSQRESAVTAMAARLLKAGYITRSRSANDARAWELNATPSGRQAIAKMQMAFDQVNAKLDQCMSGDEIGILADSLSKMLEAFEE